MNKKIALAIYLALGTGIAAAAAPAQKLPVLGADAKKVGTPYQFTVGITAHNELYEEFAQGEKLMKEEAPMTGIKVGVSRAVGKTGGSLGLSAHLALGQAKYTGSYQGGNYGDVAVSGLDRTLVELEATYKHTVAAWKGITPSVGLGYRHLTDHLEQAGAGGYERENNRIYLALGVERPFSLGGAWTVTPAARYKQSLWSQQFSDIYGGVYHRQNTGSGYDLSLDVQYKQPKYTVAVTPYLRTWKMADSHTVSYTYEPKNETREAGFELSARF